MIKRGIKFYFIYYLLFIKVVYKKILTNIGFGVSFHRSLPFSVYYYFFFI
jgi:hypothetical protein